MSKATAEIYRAQMTPLPMPTPVKPGQTLNEKYEEDQKVYLAVVKQNGALAFDMAARDSDAVRSYMSKEENVVDIGILEVFLEFCIEAFGKKEGAEVCKECLERESTRLTSEGITTLRNIPKMSFIWSEEQHVFDTWLKGTSFLTPWEELSQAKGFKDMPENTGVPKGMKTNEYLNQREREVISTVEKNLYYTILEDTHTSDALRDYRVNPDHDHIMAPMPLEEIKSQLISEFGEYWGKQAFASVYGRMSFELSRKDGQKLMMEEREDGTTVYISQKCNSIKSAVNNYIAKMDFVFEGIANPETEVSVLGMYNSKLPTPHLSKVPDVQEPQEVSEQPSEKKAEEGKEASEQIVVKDGSAQTAQPQKAEPAHQQESHEKPQKDFFDDLLTMLNGHK